MPVSAYLKDKWECALQSWAVHRAGSGARVSSAYDPAQWQRTASTSGGSVVSDQAQHVDDLLGMIRADRRKGGDRVANALREWVLDEGTKGEQAARLSVHVDTYRELVDAGVRWLERLSRKGRKHGR